MTLKTRRPTGKPPWPMLLLAGTEKSGKSYACAVASASEHIGRTFWISVGEDDPDEYGAIDGARFEIVEHDGTYRGILAAIEAAAAVPAEGGKPNLIVVDSIGRLWELLSDMAQVEANRRKKRDEAIITMDQWNLAKQRWAHVISALKEHDGPVIVTSRMEKVTVLGEDGQPAKDARGNPTGEKIFKVKAEKSLPFDVGAIVELHARGEYWLTGVRSLKFKPEPGVAVPYPDFTVEKLWTDLGVTKPGATAPRQVSHLDAEGEQQAQQQPVVDHAWTQARQAAWEATENRASSKEARTKLWQDFHADTPQPTVKDFQRITAVWSKPNPVDEALKAIQPQDETDWPQGDDPTSRSDAEVREQHRDDSPRNT